MHWKHSQPSVYMFEKKDNGGKVGGKGEKVRRGEWRICHSQPLPKCRAITKALQEKTEEQSQVKVKKKKANETSKLFEQGPRIQGRTCEGERTRRGGVHNGLCEEKKR